jgi:hypothetical protein
MADTLKDKDFAAIKVLPKKATGTVAIFSHKVPRFFLSLVT